jgi:adenylate cyclase
MKSAEDLLSQADLLTLVKSVRELSTQMDLRKLIQEILARAGDLTDSPDASVILYNERRDSLYFAAATGSKGEMLLERMGENSLEQVRMESIAGEVFRNGQSRIVREVAEDPHHQKSVDSLTNTKSRSMVCVPLNAAGEKLGVMQLLNKRAGDYSERDQVLLEHFSDQAAVAIRNARLVSSLVAHMGLYGNPDQGPFEMVKEIEKPVHDEELTIMFADMRGFTLLCQDLGNPGKIKIVLDQFLSMLTDEVVRYGGIVNKFLGDGMLAIFRDTGDKDYARRAVLCAFKIIEHFKTLAADWDKSSNVPLKYLDVGFGITTDTVMIGPICSRGLRDFTVYGDAVNLASLFCKQARKGKRVLADHSTYLSVQELVETVSSPETSELMWPDYGRGRTYKRYHLVPLQTDKAEGDLVFLSHNSKDKPAVRELGEALKKRGLKVWLDEWNLIPGRPWQDALEDVIKSAKSAAILVGGDGLGPWEIPEMRLCLMEFVQRTLPVIPVLLPGAPTSPDLPLFLRQFTWVDLRGGMTKDGLDRLEWGITGHKPQKS